MRTEDFRKALAPWEIISLILDRAVDPDIHRTIYRLEANPQASPIYDPKTNRANQKVSPWIVRTAVDSPLAEHFYAQAQQEYIGCLLTGHVPLKKAIAHFRWLTRARHPNGRRVYFRPYDPRVFPWLVHSCDVGEMAEIMGPFEQVWIWNPEDHWIGYDRGDLVYPEHEEDEIPAPEDLNYAKRLRLSERHLEGCRLGAQEYFAHRAAAHINRYFPALPYADQTTLECARDLLEKARQLGFKSRMAQLYFINAHGYLLQVNQNPLTTERYPDIRDLLTAHNDTLTPNKRALQAATLAKSYATVRS